MTKAVITRSEFLRGGSCAAAGAILRGMIAPDSAPADSPARPCSASDGAKAAKGEYGALILRPYQLLCLVCAAGAESGQPKEERLKEVLAAIREDPDRPISLRCNAGDVYYYQDPGAGEDTPEGADFNRKRDLDVLHKLGLAPGCVLPARALLLTLLKTTPAVDAICGYATVTGKGWEGCPKAKSGNYEKGCKKGIGVLIPSRSQQEMEAEKQRSLAAMRSAAEVTVRPHILMCAVCQYGGGVRPPFKPDNLPELLEMILTIRRDVRIKFARSADWMMCAPCPNRSAKHNACVNTLGSGGLSNEKRDLDMLRILGMHFGDSMKAKELLRLILEKIPSTQEVCRREQPCPCVWWDGCGESNRKEANQKYQKGREELLAKLT